MILLLLYEYSLSGGDTQTLLAVNFFFMNFLRSQAASDANIGIIANFV